MEQCDARTLPVRAHALSQPGRCLRHLLCLLAAGSLQEPKAVETTVARPESDGTELRPRWRPLCVPVRAADLSA